MLDQHHRTFALYHRDVAEGLLALADCWSGLHDYINANDDASSTSGLGMALHLSIRGFGHCIRWLRLRSGPMLSLPAADYKSLQDEAQAFLRWGMDYEQLVVEHTAWSRGFLKAECRPDEQSITFTLSEHFDPHYLVSQQASQELVSEDLMAAYPWDLVREGFRPWLRWTTESRKYWNWYASPPVLDAYQGVRQWLESILLPQVDQRTEVSGYSLSEFSGVWAYFHLLGEYWTRAAQQYLLTRREPDTGYGSVLILDHRTIIPDLAQLIGSSQPRVLNVIRALSFDHRSQHHTLVSQPLIPIAPGEFLFLPSLITALNPWEVLTRGLRTERKVYSKISSRLESAALGEICELLRQSRFRVEREARLQTPVGKQLCPDLLVFNDQNDNEQQNEVLLIEYKHALSPYGPAELLNRLADVKGWLAKLVRYRDAVLNSEFMTQSGTDTVYVGAILLLRWPTPLPMARHDGVTVIDWLSLKQYLTSQSSAPQLSEVFRWAEHRDDIGITAAVRATTDTIRVGGWTYNKTVFVG